jgi:hypothetical protein
MKKIKPVFILIVTSIIIQSCGINSNLKKFDKKNKFHNNKSVLGLNSINADNNHYTKAVLDYLLVKRILDGNSFDYFGMPQNLPQKPVIDSIVIKKKVVFPQLQDFYNANTKFDSLTIKKLESYGLNECIYDIPKKLNDLNSGFQFNHYVFKSSNRAAMQAFGIVNSSIELNSLYIVTDYLQYKDITCTGIPKFRYAVGIRAEFRLIGVESESELSGIGSLAGLAAQVETNQMQVNITIKTIGVTGTKSRLSIPSTTSFDVKTYSDYEKILDFIRNLSEEQENNEELIIHPELIPVMDEYRTTLEHSFYPLMETIEVLELKLSELEKDNDKKEKIQLIKDKITSLKLNLLDYEVEKLIGERIKLIQNDSAINNYSDLIDLIDLLKNKEINKEEFIKKINE